MEDKLSLCERIETYFIKGHDDFREYYCILVKDWRAILKGLIEELDKMAEAIQKEQDKYCSLNT